MKPSPKFNHRPKHERVTHCDLTPHAVFFSTGAVDDDFEDFGERTDYVVAPELVVHHLYLDNGFPSVAIERVRPAVD